MTAARPSVAPPPGMEGPTATSTIQVPRASEDPFGAMGAMAQQAQAQAYAAPRAQEFVVVNDGRPVEQVAQSGKAARIGKIAAMVVAPLVVGVLVGGAGKQNAIHNRGVSDAAVVLTDVSAIRRDLVAIESAMVDAKGAMDKKLTEQMNKFLETKFQPEVVFQAQPIAMGANTSAQVNTFYAGVTELRALIKSHVVLATQDDAKLTEAARKAAAARYGEMPYRYAVVVTAPPDGQQGKFGAQLVELGAPTCTDADCNQVTGFEYFLTSGGTRIKGSLASPGAIEPNQVIPLLATNAMNGLVQGSEASAAEFHYRRRVALIADKLKELLQAGSALEQKLKQVSNTRSRFTFFM
ncbi:MAG: hypothetical protein IPL79_04085 [Myxococcales bacterium]|nr:hypothetical protein [Myxococcales bacterium]